jgi:tetratricopeptide (TPR) repeat protein
MKFNQIPLIAVGLTSFVVIGLIVFASRDALPANLRYPFAGSQQLRAKTRTADYQQEIKFYLQRIQRNPNDGLDRAALATTYLKRARVTARANDYFLAEQAAQRSLAALPVLNSGALMVLAEVSLARHDFIETKRLLEQLKTITPHSVGVLSLEATLYLALGDVKKANLITQTLLKSVPTAANYIQLGLLNEAQGQNAEPNYLIALTLEEADDPVGSARTRTFLARWYLKHGQLPLAKDLLVQVQQIVPNDAQSAMLLADTQLQMGHLEVALNMYQGILEDSKNTLTLLNHAALRGMARVKRLLGQDNLVLWQEAKDALRSELKKGAFGHTRELAALLLESGQKTDFQEALRLAMQEALIRADSETLHVLAWAQLETGQPKKALLTMQRAMQFGIKDAVLTYRMGLIQQALGQEKIAQTWFEKAKIMNPALNSQVRLALGLQK